MVNQQQRAALIASVESVRRDELKARQAESLAAYYERKAAYVRGGCQPLPDPRNLDLLDRWAVIDFDRRVLLNQRQRADREFWRRVHEARQRFFDEPLPANVTRLHR